MITRIYHENETAACFFRSTEALPNRKVILQVTEKCNLQCKHCFVSSTAIGDSMTAEQLESIIPILTKANVNRITLTGGEPFCNMQLLDMINMLTRKSIHVSVCTNATMVTKHFINGIEDKRLVHFNVSLDGFKPESHGMFRGNPEPVLFRKLLDNITMISTEKLLNGMLSTPNKFASIDEYIMICEFARQLQARYVLFNPLSEFGRGQEGIKLEYSFEEMEELRQATQYYNDTNFEVVYIRFPQKNKPISNCPKGSICYVFTNGDVTVCPYLVFAANDSVSRYDPKLFLIGNVYERGYDLEEHIVNYQFPALKFKAPSSCCIQNCSGGCYAAKISQGRDLNECDLEMCLKEK